MAICVVEEMQPLSSVKCPAFRKLVSKIPSQNHKVILQCQKLDYSKAIIAITFLLQCPIEPVYITNYKADCLLTLFAQHNFQHVLPVLKTKQLKKQKQKLLKDSNILFIKTKV